MTVGQVAAQLRVAKSTVYGLCARGELVHVRVSNAIRVSKGAVDAYCVEYLKLPKESLSKD